MQPAASTTSARLEPDWLSISIYAIALLIGIIVFLASPKRSVSFNYEIAAQQWMQGEPIYAASKESGHGFLYFPQAAILHIPFAAVSQLSKAPVLGDVVWRVVSWIVFSIGCMRLARWLGPSDSAAHWPVALVASLLGLNSLRIGQSTVMLTGCMILAVDAWRSQRLSAASALVGLSIAFKPLAIVLALLLLVISPPMRWRLLISGLLVAAIPFLLQHPAYVVAQYEECFKMLRTAADLGNNFRWAQLFGLLHFTGVSVPTSMQTAIRIVAAGATLGGLLWVSRRSSIERLSFWLLSLTMLYLLLFNPRTENSTYCLLGPVLGYAIAENAQRRGSRFSTAMLWTLVIATMGSYEIGKRLTPSGVDAVWLAPLGCCLFVIYLAIRMRKPDSYPQR